MRKGGKKNSSRTDYNSIYAKNHDTYIDMKRDSEDLG